jgi:hypothetical protein
MIGEFGRPQSDRRNAHTIDSYHRMARREQCQIHEQREGPRRGTYE